MITLTGKVGIVTGASRSSGEGIAKEFRRSGCFCPRECYSSIVEYIGIPNSACHSS